MVETVNKINYLGYAAHLAGERNTPQAIRSLMQNTVYGLLDGRVVHAYSKQGNYKEEIGDPSLVFAHGGNCGVQEIEGIRFGLEVALLKPSISEPRGA